MTDQEKNEAIAKRLGWRKSTELENIWGKAWILEKKDKTPSICYALPDYLNDIMAAWEIVDKFPFIDDGKIKDKLAFQLMRRSKNEMIPEVNWEAGWARYDDCMIVSAYADTASRAICEAFLKLP